MARQPSKQTKRQVYSLSKLKTSKSASNRKDAGPNLQTNILAKLENELKSNQSKISLFLGALIVLVIGILIFNYFSKSQPDLGPSQQTEQVKEDVSPESLPGKYTVKEDDTLFVIAEKYYQDGNKFTEIATANNLVDPNTIEVGQVLEIPKLGEITPSPSPQTPAASPTDSTEQIESEDPGTGGGDSTIWGPKIEGDSYTIQEGDWLSTIAGRAYGDIFAYQKLAEVNNIPNPDLIFPGQVIKIPR